MRLQLQNIASFAENPSKNTQNTTKTQRAKTPDLAAVVDADGFRIGMVVLVRQNRGVLRPFMDVDVVHVVCAGSCCDDAGHSGFHAGALET